MIIASVYTLKVGKWLDRKFMKKEVFEELLKLMSKCNKCTNFRCKEKSLINIYNDYNF